MAKLFSFRFDVDTHRCVRVGMPALSELGHRIDARFTFFVNMGRAVSRATLLARLRGGSPRGRQGDQAEAEVAAKLPARVKLGWTGSLVAAVVNPRVGAGSPGVVRAARRLGHEIGLHGGLNHALWQREAAGWPAERLATEIDAVLPTLTTLLGGEAPAGFASPGWTTHPALPALLAPRGFTYLADLHGPGPDPAPSGGVVGVRTRLTGEPGGVAYLEHLRAAGLDDTRLERRFEEDLERAGPIAVVYDHPYFAGVHELRTVERIVAIARAHGYDVVPLRDAAQATVP